MAKATNKKTTAKNQAKTAASKPVADKSNPVDTVVSTPNIKKQKNDQKNIFVSKTILKYGCGILIAGCLAFICVVSRDLAGQVVALQKQQNLLQQELEKSKTVYVFNLEKVVSSSDLVSIQKDFEEQTEKLSKEVDAAKEKIAGLKKSKVNEDFSEVYMKSLILKRDELIEKHQKQMTEVTLNINKALAEVAKEKGATAVFNNKAIAAMSSDVVDISDDVITKINALLREEKNQ